MKKKYEIPRIYLTHVCLEDPLISGSNYIFREVITDSEGMKISDYDFVEEINKDFNIDF